MTASPNNTPDLYFLARGGDMGQLIRATDWTKTPLGHPTTWPQSLRTMVATILDNPFGMYIAWGPDYTQIYNDGYRPILGTTKHPRALGIGTRDTFSEIWPVIGPMFEGVMNGKAVGFPDFRLMLNRNGYEEECFFDFSYSPIRKDDGEVGGVLVTVIETTEKKRAVTQLLESENRFRTMADNIPNLAWMANADGWIYWYNKKWFDYTGTTEEQMMGWSWQSVHDPQKLPEVVARWQDSIQHSKPFEMVFPIRGANGIFRQFLTRVVPMFDEEGKLYQWFGTNTDITEQIEAEQKLKESEERFRTMAEGTDVLIAVGDETGNAIYFNKAYTELAGRSMDDLLKFNWVDLLHPDDRPSFVSAYTNALEHQKPFESEVRVLVKNGDYRWLLLKAAPRFRPDGSFAGYISSSLDVTERLRAEREIKESEKRFRYLIEEAVVPTVLLVGPDLVIELANQAMIEGMNRGPSVIGKPLLDVMPEFRAQPFYAEMKEVYATGKSISGKEVRADFVVDGKPAVGYYDYTYKPLFNAANEVYAVMGTSINVTEKVVARKKIQEAEEKARLAIQSADLGLYELVYASRDLITDDRFKEIWGVDNDYSRDEYASAIHPDDLLIRQRAHELSIQTGHLDYMARILWKDKSVHWVRVSGKVIFNDEGEPQKLIGVIQDVTDTVLTQQKIQESENNLRQTILQAPVAMCIFRGPTHVVEMANERMFELWGKRPEEVMHKPIFEGLPEARNQGLEPLIDNVYATGETYAAQDVPVNLPRSGSLETVYVNFVWEAYREASGSVSGILAVAVDVTAQVIARQKIEEIVAQRTNELAEANSDLQRSNAELAQFAYIASHDLQEPLRKIVIFGNLLSNRAGVAVDEQSRNYLNKITNSAARMTALIRDVLTYSELVKKNEIFEKVNLNQIIELIKSDFEVLIEQKEATIQSDELPPIDAIPLQMSQLFGNLISNSLKFTRKEVKPVITISCTQLTPQETQQSGLDRSLNYIKIQIRDNGIGFQEEFAEKIFSIFQRLHRKSEFDGTGIGLAICKKIVLNHGGLLNAAGSSEQGAVFNIVLPLRQAFSFVG